MPGSRFVACRECDLLHQRVPLPRDGVAHCRRCGAVLYAHRHDRSDQTLAWALAGIVLFVIANAFPVLSIEVQGASGQATLVSSVVQLWEQQRPFVATVVFFTGVVAPLTLLLGVLYVLLPVRFGRVPRHLRRALRIMDAARPWSMVSIFMLAILVSLTKLAAMADIILGAGLWAMAGMIVALAATDASFDPEPIWDHVPPVAP